jgi:hypothetical protein
MAGSRHPVCGHRHRTKVKDGTSALLAAPKAGSQGLALPERRVHMCLKTLVFDGEMLHRLFWSTAYEIAVASNILLKPMESKDSDPAGVKFFTAVLPNRYLSKEIDLPPDRVLQKLADDGANEFGDLFWQELDERGPEGVKIFLADVEAQRENAIAKTRQIYREASDYNQGADQHRENFRHGLIAIKCASTIVVAGLTLPFVAPAAAGAAWATAGTIGSLTGFGIGTTYSITLELVKHWDDSDTADLVLVGTEKGGSKTGQKVTKEIFKAEGKKLEPKAEALLKDALQRVKWLTKPLKGSPTVEKIAKRADKLADARYGVQVAKNLGRLATAFKTVPYLFFAWSAGNALYDAHKEW